jgi:hypothetical protein
MDNLLDIASQETRTWNASRRLRIGARFALFCLALALTALPASAKPGVSVTNSPTTSGGTLFVNGSGFTKGEQVQISVTNTPGSPKTQKIGTAVATVTKAGSFSLKIPYSFSPYSGLPGCAFSSTKTVTITIHATEVKSKQKASGQTYIRDCLVYW